jgi:hypothetical protein
VGLWLAKWWVFDQDSDIPTHHTFEFAFMLSSIENPLFFPCNSLSISLHLTLLCDAPFIVCMRAKRQDQICDSVKATGSDRYGDSRLSFQNTMRSIIWKHGDKDLASHANNKYLPVPSDAVFDNLVECDQAAHGIIKLKIPVEFAKFHWFKVFGKEVRFLLSFELLWERPWWGCIAAASCKVKWDMIELGFLHGRHVWVNVERAIGSYSHHSYKTNCLFECRPWLVEQSQRSELKMAKITHLRNWMPSKPMSDIGLALVSSNRDVGGTNYAPKNEDCTSKEFQSHCKRQTKGFANKLNSHLKVFSTLAVINWNHRMKL